jgi:hypothetical protein
VSTAFFGGSFFGGEFFSTSSGVVTPIVTTKTGTGGIDLPRAVKPVPFLGKGRPKERVEQRVDETREIHAEVAGKLARELSEIEDVEVPISELTMFQVDQEIGRLLRKVQRTQEEEILLLMLMVV